MRAETARLVAAVPPEGLRRLLARKAAKAYPGGLAAATRACGYMDDSRSGGFRRLLKELLNIFERMKGLVVAKMFEPRPDWLIPMDKDKLPQPAKEFFPK